jgi:hypothetical protein
MKKRVFATVLWFYVGWYAGAFVAELVGASSNLGLVVGLGIATFVAIDPARMIWAHTRAVPASDAEQVAEPVTV